MFQYKAGYKFVDGGVHAQVLDIPAAITCADDLDGARRLPASALLDVAEAAVESGLPLPIPDALSTNSEMDVEDPIYLHLHVSSDVQHLPAGVVVP